MKQTLIDTIPFKVLPQQLIEGKQSENGNLLVRGKLQTAETKNGNGRVYPMKVLQREVKKYSEGPIKESRAMGELDHPDDSIINLKNVSHIIREATWDGDDVIGLIEILPTPSGNILKELFNNGITVGVSSRGMGSLTQIGETLEVQDDFELLCWDFVSTPSTPGAYVAPLNESLQTQQDPYKDVNRVITDILCSKGSCPIL
tara:strand:- start:317 stop:922 length:606 start_codon:yes stop_codon:yes gene_type:complete